MYKKIGISLLLAFAMLVSMFNVGIAVPVSTAPCGSISECRAIIRETQENIAEIIEEEEEANIILTEIRSDISDLRAEIAEKELVVAGLASQIAILGSSISDLEIEMRENLEILEETEIQIEVLIGEVAQRMRAAQRANNTNSFLSLLSEAENLTDLVRKMRTFNRLATEDTEVMNELTELAEFYDNLLLELDEQRIQFEADRSEYETRRTEFEAEQARLESAQAVLITRETEMQDRLYALNLERMTEQEQLDIAAATQEILERTPPPPIRTPNNGSNSNANSGSNSSAPPGDLGTVSSSGMINPLPGGHVSSHFGPRWGSHHAGIDLVVSGNPSAPIVAAASGTVTFSGWGNGFGWYMIIAHDINGQRVDTMYAHLCYQSPVAPGTVVSQGDVIATKGSTGRSTGPHLHFEVHPGGFNYNTGVNPASWIGF